jgi:hypothetical protein
VNTDEFAMNPGLRLQYAKHPAYSNTLTAPSLPYMASLAVAQHR